MSGLVRFFQPFHHCNGNAAANDDESDQVAAASYSQSLENSDAHANVTITELEETKTFAEWRQIYKETFLQYISPRMFPNDDEECFQTEQGIYWAARFGFVPANVAAKRLSQQEDGGKSGVDAGGGGGDDGSSGDELDLLQTQDELPHQNSESTPPSGSRQESVGAKHVWGEIVPAVNKATHKAKSISEIDLLTSNLSVQLSSVRLLWKKRKTKGSIPLGQSNEDPIPFPQAWMDQGPLHQNYKRVVSMEIMEVDLSPSGSSRREISTVAEAAFGVKAKRVRVFFYNYYAEAMTKLIEKAERAARASNIKSKECVRDKMMVSLRNIPARCILPFHTHAFRNDAHGKLLEHDYGRLASYCVCIGGESNIICDEGNNQENKDVKMRFDSGELEIGVLIIGPTNTKTGTDGDDHVEINEYALNQTNVDKIEKGARIGETEIRKRGEMLKLFSDLKKLERASSAQSNIGAQSSSPERLFATAASGSKRRAQHDMRPYITLNDAHDFYLRNVNKERKKREISIYAGVLNVGPPRRTKRDWMMNIALIDDSLPLPTKVRDNNDADQNGISQVKLTIFAEQITDFPIVECAGDIIHCQRVLVGEYNGEISLTAFRWCKIAVCRPTPDAILSYENQIEGGAPPNPGDSKDDWVHEKNMSISLDFNKINSLWRFCRKRMSSCPNVDSRYKVTNADLGINRQDQHCGESEKMLAGDLTALICAVIPFPEARQTLRTPKGLVRVWDGTGIHHSDALPEKFPVEVGWASREEPSEEVLLSLSEIVKNMKNRHYGFRTSNGDENLIQDLDAPKCLCGKVINLVIWEAVHWDMIIRGSRSNFKVGKFIRVRNAIAKVDGSVWSLQVNVNTFITPVPNSCYEVKSLIIDHHRKVQQNHPFNIKSACLPLKLPESITGKLNALNDSQEIFSPNEDMRTLIDCVIAPSPRSFKVRFRIMNMKPRLKGESLREVCISNKKFTKFQFILNISDPYFDLAVIVPNIMAERMFGMTARQVKDELENKKISLQQKSACLLMKSLAKQEEVVEGTITSMLAGDDGSKYFLLSSVPALIGNEISKST